MGLGPQKPAESFCKVAISFFTEITPEKTYRTRACQLGIQLVHGPLCHWPPLLWFLPENQSLFSNAHTAWIACPFASAVHPSLTVSTMALRAAFLDLQALLRLDHRSLHACLRQACLWPTSMTVDFEVWI